MPSDYDVSRLARKRCSRNMPNGHSKIFGPNTLDHHSRNPDAWNVDSAEGRSFSDTASQGYFYGLPGLRRFRGRHTLCEPRNLGGLVQSGLQIREAAINECQAADGKKEASRGMLELLPACILRFSPQKPDDHTGPCINPQE